MSEFLSYRLSDGVAILRMDDGKANAWGFGMMEAIHAGLGRALADQAMVVLTGRQDLFSGGMDLGVYHRGGGDVVRMMAAGTEILRSMLEFPRPVMAAVTGHAVGMGAICLLACDFRLAVAEGALIQTNEVQMGAPMPHTALALARARLTAPHIYASMLTAAAHTPSEALAAGYLDALAPAADFQARIVAQAQRLLKLDPKAFTETKRRLNAPVLAALAETSPRDTDFFAAKFGAMGALAS
jgi:enoyl-CoA hydratase